ncbi:cyclic nucleotide-binding domain-containing protein [Actinomadura rupiterrae]|uniref:cyclic nucleotide-binding domain-containing protein n=1 Tax=Actinomadura rupiterrae TaxID=559627 RepID=UPI0020A5BBE9|nr:cyclic nucleotide-binding domain-containing protein [Actinomadura rupiterrae]MCP2337451.1 hypothetical protein [Actinomadura rupiterrae]
MVLACLALLALTLVLAHWGTGSRALAVVAWTVVGALASTLYFYLQVVLIRRMLETAGPDTTARARESRPSFWALLDDHERSELLVRGVWRRFEQAVVIFREGAPADHVLVIFTGRVVVGAWRGNRAWQLPIRGPGQLIGERAALRPSVRSATVTALEPVDALVIGTAEFLEFATRHPRVLALLEDQIYDRLTEPPAGGLPVAAPSLMPAGATRPRFGGEHCTVVMLDVVGFSSELRTDDDRDYLRAVLNTLVAEAACRAWDGGLDRCHWEDRGDGYLIIVPPTVSVRTVLAAIPPLERELRRHNRRSTAPVRMSLRLAVNVGPVRSDTAGVSGQAIIHAARILEAEPVKRALASSNAYLGVVTSETVYRDVVRHAVEDLDAHEYEQFSAHVKESELTAWLRLTGLPARVCAPAT